MLEIVLQREKTYLKNAARLYGLLKGSNTGHGNGATTVPKIEDKDEQINHWVQD